MKSFKEWAIESKINENLAPAPTNLKSLVDNLYSNLQFAIQREFLDPKVGKNLMDHVALIQKALQTQTNQPAAVQPPPLPQ